MNKTPLTLSVGERRLSPCDHETFGRFKLWVAEKLAGARIDRYQSESVTIEPARPVASDS